MVEKVPNANIFADIESQVRSYCRSFPVVFDRAEGARLFNENGHEYLDFFAGAGTLNYGHCEPRMREKLMTYLSCGGVLHSLDMFTSAKREFLTRFRDIVLKPRGMEYKVQFTGPTGADSVEAALKLARIATGRSKVFAFTNGYHGMTLGALSVTNQMAARAGAGVPLDHVAVMPFDGFLGAEQDSLGHIETALEIAKRYGDLPAAFILETVQAEGGINVAREDWLQGLESLARRFGVLLIVDDIQAGCGRTGPFFSFEPAGLKPDIVCLSKSLSGFGLPLSCTLIRPDLDVWKPGQHTGTFRGNNLAFVTGAQALSYWESNTLEQSVAAKGAIVKNRLETISNKHPSAAMDVRGRGLIWGVDFHEVNFACILSRDAFARGLVIETAGPVSSVLKLLPPLTIDAESLHRGLDIVEEVIDHNLSSGFAPHVKAVD